MFRAIKSDSERDDLADDLDRILGDDDDTVDWDSSDTLSPAQVTNSHRNNISNYKSLCNQYYFILSEVYSNSKKMSIILQYEPSELRGRLIDQNVITLMVLVANLANTK